MSTQDCQRIVNVAAQNGYGITLDIADKLWRNISGDRWAAGWYGMSHLSDDELWKIINDETYLGNFKAIVNLSEYERLAQIVKPFLNADSEISDILRTIDREGNWGWFIDVRGYCGPNDSSNNRDMWPAILKAGYENVEIRYEW
jgi:hypothetical protein